MKPQAARLSRRERQIMDAIYALGKATVADVRNSLADPPSYSAVRALMRILEEKGHLRHTQDGPRYVYFPTQPRKGAARTAIQHVVSTFFGGSIEQAVAALLSEDETRLSEVEADRLAKMIEEARSTKEAESGSAKSAREEKKR